MMREVIGAAARWRLDHERYELPFELWLRTALHRLAEGPKPMVDAQHLSSEPVTC